MSTLTPRERQVCGLIQNQPKLTVKGIGHQVGIKPATAKFHLENAYKKLNVSCRAELVANLCKAK